MADTVKISGLPSATTTTGADYVPIVQDGITKKAPLNVLGSGAGISKVSDEGLRAYWNMDSVPEMPDDPDGVTYLQDAWATVDGWLAANANNVVSVENSKLKIVYDGGGINGTNWYKAVSTWGAKTIRMRFVSTTPIIKIEYFNGTAQVIIPASRIISATEWIIDFVPTYTYANFLFYVNRGTFVANTVYVDWIYIGTGAYLPNSLIDNSGNGRGATVKGSTPVAGTSGKALSRDQLNDYEVTDAAQTMPDIFWYHEIWTVPNHATQIQILYSVGAGASPKLLMYRSANSRNLVIAYYNGAIVIDLSVATFFPATTLPVVADIIVNWLTGVILVYKDGAYFATVNMVSAVKPSPALWYFGNQSALSATQFAGGIVDERRVYNVIPSADEVHSLFVNKGRGPDCQVKSVAPLKDSLVVRDPLGNIQANGLKFPGTQVASTDPNTLDDYEEGTFTPVLQFGGASVGITYIVQTGSYTKIGRDVQFTIQVVLSSKGTSIGAATISGLPFVTNTNYLYALSLRINLLTFAIFPSARTGQSSSAITLEEITGAGALTSLTEGDFSNTSNIIVSGSYSV